MMTFVGLCASTFSFRIAAVVHSGERLPPSERGVLEEACNDALTKLIFALRPSIVIGVGNFAGTKCLEVCVCHINCT